MTTYRVEVDGQTVWSETTDGYQGLGVYPREFFLRPTDTPDDEAHPHPAHLYLDNGDDAGDTLIGIQRSHSDEADQLNQAADAINGDDPTAAFLARLDAHEARAKSKEVLGDPVAAARHRAERAMFVVAQIDGHPEYVEAMTAKGV